ncbi:MAG: Phosphoribosylformylglycinamidine synthase [Sodalis sp.]|nr:MAG: Phosphoribosylformylglycinamidine synthase [Sodalis sp.]
MTAPLSLLTLLMSLLIITAFDRAEDVRSTATPQLQLTRDNALLIDFVAGHQGGPLQH